MARFLFQRMKKICNNWTQLAELGQGEIQKHSRQRDRWEYTIWGRENDLGKQRDGWEHTIRGRENDFSKQRDGWEYTIWGRENDLNK